MAEYSHPESLVTADWVAEHGNDANVRLVEVDVDTSAYDEGHIAGAVGWNWQSQLQASLRRDLISGPELEALLGVAGIDNNTTVILYGDNNNWFAAWAFWQLKYYGHGDVRLMNGGRAKWVADGRALTTDAPSHAAKSYRASEPNQDIRAYRDAVLGAVAASSISLVDVRAPAEYSGELLAPANLPQQLARISTGKTVYILDEPTTGLHFEDCKKLLDVLHRLVDLGNTVICIEHNMDLIKTADWLIDMGPEAGDGGGEIVIAGTPEKVAKCRKSHTGKVLAGVLGEGRYAEREVFTLEEAAKRQARIESKLTMIGAEDDTKLPWEQNGRRWHTGQCLASDGSSSRSWHLVLWRSRRVFPTDRL